ncbi:MAG: rod shape-determining protein MreC [Omnitrophica WOR_2 bacterium RIFCSPHIGHO2_01_FULL_48_9]|nr:MAG: rod shape-determining protein MreC [Omnitrophica WOR_2 bacterium RIFCSPHIGHO2_02_FULL_48_11]OGX31186.1 MAG: rod shape-determining protein MreC [Omnitrophica WOR_2 bacterium RIFCSPHIGHO2_01_FULL_48_9]
MSKRYFKSLIYLAVFIIPFLFLFLHASTFSPVKFKVAELVSLPAQIISFPVRELKKLLYYHRTFAEYVRLSKEVNILKTRLVGLEEVVRENSRLEQLLRFKRNLIYASVPANVIGRDPANWNSSMIVDRGTKDGVSVGMPVVSAAGVVGRVAEVSPSMSRVILLTDPQFSVAALVQSPRESGLISGSLQGICRLRYVSSEASIQIGDEVITSKLSTSFPEGLLIGKIIGIKGTADNPAMEYVVQPAVSLSKIEEVLIIQK